MGYNPTDYSYMNLCIEIFVAIAVKDIIGGGLHELHKLPLLFIQSSLINS